MLLIAAPLIHWFALGPRVPAETFILLSQLSATAPLDDPSNFIYSFARPPVYAVLGWIWVYPTALLLIGFLAHVAFNLCVFSMALLACRDLRPAIVPAWAVAVVVASLVLPVGTLAHLVGHGTTLVPHDTYHTFSFRTFAFTAIAIGYCFLVAGRIQWSLWAAALSCYLHPTLGLIAFGLFTFAAGLLAPPGRRFRLALHWTAAASVAVAPMVWKLYAVPFPPELDVQMSYGNWYSQMIKNEADDFSVLYQIAVLPKTIAAYYLIIGSVLYAYAKVFADFRRDVSFWFAAGVALLYAVAGLVEYAFAVLVPTPIARLLVSLTVGYRLLSFAFFPLIVLVSRLALVGLDALWHPRRGSSGVSPGLRRIRPAAAAVGTVLLVWSMQLGGGVASGNAGAAVSYGAWALSSGRVAGMDAYLLAFARAAGDQLLAPPLFGTQGAMVTYPMERDVFRIRALDRSQPARVPDRESLRLLTITGFAEFIAAMRRNIPAGQGVVVPPYIGFIRDALPAHRIFFQEHHDGNLMLGAPRFAAFWTRRMIDLLGFDYEDMPSQYSGLSYTKMRSAYLGIDGAHVERLRARYPAFRYFVTEQAHSLPYEVAFSASGLTVYDMGRPTGAR
jgi:hypothetical protein